MKMWLRLKIEEFWIVLAQIAPRGLVYYCGVRIISELQKSKKYENNDKITASQEVLARWNRL